MSESSARPSRHLSRKWVSEPFNLDGQAADEQAFYRQQSYLGAGRGATSYSRSHSPLMHAYTDARALLLPNAEFRGVMSPSIGPRQSYKDLRPVMSPYTEPRQEEVPMTDYFPPVELITPTASPNKDLHSLVVGNLDSSMTTQRLTTMFETVKGFVPSFTSAKIMEHPQTHESLGYAIAYFGKERDQQ